MNDSADLPPTPPPGGADPEGLDNPRVTRALEDYLTAIEAGRPPNRAEFLARHTDIAPALAGCLTGLEVLAPVHRREPLAAADGGSPKGESADGLESLVGRVADEFTERLRRGECPDVEEYARRHPRAAPLLREVLQALQALTPSATSAFPPSADPPGGVLGDFRILREVGRGGMGVVYEAEQVSLGRRVALKVLPAASVLDPKSLQRFRNEAQAAAHLNHPNIVPVYAVGCERGIHFYAMQLIEGQTVAALVRQLRETSGPGDAATIDGRLSPPGPNPPDPPGVPPRGGTDWRALARLGVQAAEALDHAHQLGVVHRDIKPANLLLDGGSHLWVTDFGLSQFQGNPVLTLTGDVLGTLRYMSPEQALGHRGLVDHRTDVYALGATLYELLTLRPAVDGQDREELLHRIAFAEPVPPRRLNPAVPADLETIVLKALARAPEERYATAKELGEDLRRFLEDRPILARRPTVLVRWRKWARRHRPVVWSAAAALFVTLAVLAGSVGWVVRDQAARQSKVATDLRAALDEADRYRREGKWPQAQAAAKRAAALLRYGAHDPALAERVGALLQTLAEEEADRQLLAHLEGIRRRQAGIDPKENRFTLDEALPMYREAFGRYGWRPSVTTPKEAAARLRRRPRAVQGPLLAALDHWLILARYRKAPETGWLERVLAAADTDPWRQGLRAARGRDDRQALEKLAREVDVAAQPPEALFLLDLALCQRGATESAVALLRRAQETFPGDFWINHDLAMALQQCRPPRYDEAIRFLTAAVALRPESAGARNNLGVALWRSGRLDEAAAAFRKAIDLEPDYAMAHFSLGVISAYQGRLEEAITAFRRAAALRPGHADAHCCLGTVLWKQGRLDEAAAAFRRAIAARPDHALAHYNLGNVLMGKDRLDEAITAYRRAIALRPDHADARCNLGVALWKEGQLDEAAAAFRRAIALRPDHADALCNLGGVLRQQGQFTQALAPLERGHELGSRRPGWAHPSARWVRECRRLIELEGRLPAVLEGKAKPASAAEGNEFGTLCYLKKHYAAAARFQAAAFAADPALADALSAGHRYEAACAAALAAAGRGEDARPLDAGERARWRRQALAWLRADLAGFAQVLKGGKAEDRRLVRTRLRHWQRDPALASLRDPAAVAKLPPAEREECRRLWAEAKALLARAGADM